MGGEDITKVTGSFGPWQKWIFAVFFYMNVVGMWHNLSVTFLAPNIEFQCLNSTEKCLLRNGNNTQPCTQWEYDTSETIVSEWDLVCDRQWLISLAKSVYMVGFLLSVIIFGQIADWIGRYPVVVICYLTSLISMFLSLLSNSYLMFIILRFFQAFGRCGLTTTGIVLLMEIVGEKHRTKVGIGIQLGWTLGFVSLTGVAYIFKHWFWLQLAMSVPILPLAFLYRLIPESPRWLLMKGKTGKLEKLLRKATKMNGKELKLTVTDLDGLRDLTQESPKSVLDLFRTPRLRIRTFCTIYLWIVVTFMYYSLSFNTNELAGDPYVNFLVAGALEVPSYAVLYWAVKRFGRRPTLVTLMVVGGIACTAIAIAPQGTPWISTSLAMAGKFCITAAFGLLYLYTNEVFPTVIRNTAIGSCSMCARIGSIVAPFVKELGEATYPWLPNVVYGFLAFSSGLLALLLPETKGRQIPDTLEEGEHFEQSPTENQNVNTIALQQSISK